MRKSLFMVLVSFGGLLPGSVQSQSTRDAGNDRASVSPARRTITGPLAPLNEAIARGATVTITLQPVLPKTVPASNYPPGSAIIGQTLTLGSVPARVWLETHITGWDPGTLKIGQVTIDAIDLDGDGGGYDGDKSTCDGLPAMGAGDLFPAIVPCDAGSCQGNPAVECLSNLDCSSAGVSGPCSAERVCTGNMVTPCQTFADCFNAGLSGQCIPKANLACRGALSGITSSCVIAEPSACEKRPDFFPPGSAFVCQYGFFNRCDPADVLNGVVGDSVFDTSYDNPRYGFVVQPGEEVTDFAPTHLATFVLDVPANAKGTYRLDYRMSETFLQNFGPPGDNQIPVGLLRRATIQIECGSCCTNFTTSGDCTDGLSEAECDALPTADVRVYRSGTTCDQEECCNCTTVMDCQDNDVCTVDVCQGSCFCTHTPVAGWNPATECCHPMTGVQALIPPSTSCKTGGCSLGGSSGAPTLTSRADGTACASADPCYTNGQCDNGQCIGEHYEGSNCPKPRFISFDISTGSTPSAYRVRMVSLHHPNPPYTGGQVADFSAYEGHYRWVGAPGAYTESGADLAPLYGALVGCDPYYQDWSSIDLLHVGGAEIVPSSLYEIQSIAQGLDINVESTYSEPLLVATARFGDVVIPNAPPSATTQPDSGDTAVLVDKFRNWPGAISKPRALLSGSGIEGIPDLGSDVDFGDISASIDAFKGRPYPYSGPVPCP